MFFVPMGLLWLLVQLQFLFWVKHWITSTFVFYWMIREDMIANKQEFDVYFPEAKHKLFANEYPTKKETQINFVIGCNKETNFDFAFTLPSRSAKEAYDCINQQLDLQLVFWLLSHLLLLLC